jgi:IS30 family transposase
MGLLDVKNIDLPVKLRRSTKKHKSRENKRILGRSIEERPECVETREEFGHWEADLVIGSKSGEDTPLLTMLERKTRSFTLIPLADKSADSVAKAFENLRAEWGDSFSRVFKTITTDNGSEFARLAELETLTQTKVYFAHPYTSWEKGSIENHNGLIRRFIPKGKRISDYSEEHILNIELWANQLPRKILGYKTPDEAFEHEMDLFFCRVTAIARPSFLARLRLPCPLGRTTSPQDRFKRIGCSTCYCNLGAKNNSLCWHKIAVCQLQ